MRMLFLQNLVDDRSESVMSYYEFLVHIQKQISKWVYFLVKVDSGNAETKRNQTRTHNKRKISGYSLKINGLFSRTLKSYNEALLLMKSYYRGIITGFVTYWIRLTSQWEDITEFITPTVIGIITFGDPWDSSIVPPPPPSSPSASLMSHDPRKINYCRRTGERRAIKGKSRRNVLGVNCRPSLFVCLFVFLENSMGNFLSVEIIKFRKFTFFINKYWSTTIWMNELTFSEGFI